ncbi:MAG: hypothetical protein UX86_C0021G0010 [Candidatus Amesbacteria bacterium GW2011_GWC1_47_15]|uniref:Uncharacterized protein n=1 Tax=Candidatus Amesbacteria bacterium GW2011_GWC1_47_15 TaxID=1618364 RepID=A0A0G1S2L0_9BACT|nr:MAG: hypothetical protein UX86_C0021G0010 [Candidatus Amesbacteria bacterium GW2011_GWC1_47_15]
MLSTTVNNIHRYGPECMTNRSSLVDGASLDALADYVSRYESELREFEKLSLGRKIISYISGDNPKVDMVYFSLAKRRLERESHK